MTTSAGPQRMKTPLPGGTDGPAGGPVLAFEAETHTYRLHDAATPAAWGQLVPSVTQVLHLVGLVDDRWYREEHRTRGRYVHKMIAYEEREGLDEASVDERLAGYLAGYRKFLADAQPGPCVLLETPLADPIRGYAGTPDQIRLLNGRLALIDHKTGSADSWHPLQSAAYVALYRLHTGDDKPVDRHTLYLKPNGTYRLSEPHRDRNDLKVFYAALAVAQFALTNGRELP